jgi:hypothetical protein
MSVLNISSRTLQQADPTLNPSDFTINFKQPLELSRQNYEVCLYRVDTWFTVQNIVGKLIDFDDGTTFYSVSIPDGTYTIEDINDIIAKTQRDNGLAEIDSLTGEVRYGITVLPNYNTNKVTITIDNTILSGAKTFTFSIGVGDAYLSDFLGFVPGNYSVTTEGTLVPQVSGGIDQWQIHCDLVRNSYDNSVVSDILYTFAPRVPPTSKIEDIPVHLNYLQVNKPQVYSIRLRLTDQIGRLIDLNGEHIDYCLRIQPRS